MLDEGGAGWYTVPRNEEEEVATQGWEQEVPDTIQAYQKP